MLQAYHKDHEQVFEYEPYTNTEPLQNASMGVTRRAGYVF